ncbi:MAG: hypothetical protein GY726_14015 [Proteobacteria bacterium]|nr:hypothetical protein [Pseudomonadota bacterium]
MVRLRAVLSGLFLLLLAPEGLAESGLKSRWNDLWRTPAQQGQRAFENGEFDKAATYYQHPMRIGSAYFRAGEFEMAASAFGRVNTPEGGYNLGTARLMAGHYAEAIISFDRALAERPGWTEAEQNRAIALARKEALEFDNDDRGKATEIGADDVVYDLDSSNKNNQDEVTTEAEQSLSDQELRALWLRKSHTSPSVFLKAKFRAQLAADTQQEITQ